MVSDTHAGVGEKPGTQALIPWSAPRTLNPWQIPVHILYKRPEIPAKKVVPAIAVSVTYSKQEKAANTGSIPVSATIFS
jgi:hypothetical protein